MFEILIDVKCTDCHHEKQVMKTGGICEWCKKGTMEKLPKTRRKYDHGSLISDIRKHHN